jgi:alpha-tubulin suppressor-like RCC1 family protein
MLLVEKLLLGVGKKPTPESTFFLHAWGSTYSGQTGKLSDPYSWTQVGGVFRNSFGLRSDGKLFFWGAAWSGAAGTGNELEFRSSPTMVGTESWLAFSLGEGGGGDQNRPSTMAIRSDGALFAWGRNLNGQLGLSDNIDRSSPVQVGTSSWTAISCYGTAVLAIRADTTLWAWGSGTNSPVQVGTDNSWVSISLSSHRAAIKSDGSLWMWGTGTSGQIGNGILNSPGAPEKFGENFGFLKNSSWNAVSTGTNHTTAIRSDGTLWSWGANSLGQCGIDSSDVQQSWTAISLGLVHAAAIRSDGALFTWGRNHGGQLGLDYNSNVVVSSPTQVGTSSWTTVATGDNHTLAIRSDGALFAWGSNSANTTGGIFELNDSGQLGLGDTVSRSSPVQVGTSSWIQVAAGRSHSAAIRSDGALFTWGENRVGQLGINDNTARSSPVQIGTSSWTLVSCGQQHTIARRTDGALFGWGLNDNGQVGALQDGFSWTILSGAKLTVTGTHAAGIRSDGALFTWGSNNFGQLGLNINPSQNMLGVNFNVPQRVFGSWITVACGDRHTAAIKSDGSLWSWGRSFGTSYLGDGTVNISRSSPVLIGGTNSFTVLSVGQGAGFAIRSNGELWGWGRGNYGQLARNTTVGLPSPAKIADGSWIAVSGGWDNASAIRNDFKLFSWGRNNLAQLGDGTVTERRSPVQIGTSSWIAVSCGISHTAAIRSDGRLFTWGGNANGQLGDGTIINRSSPVQVGTSSWTSVAVGRNNTSAIRSGGSLFTWGLNTSGQLGQNDTVARSSPVQVGTSSWTAVFQMFNDVSGRINNVTYTWGATNGGMQPAVATSSPVVIDGSRLLNVISPIQVGTSSWTALSCGRSHTAAIRSDGSLFTWGLNTSGQLGQNDTVARSSPVQVGTSSWTQINAGENFTIARRTDGALFGWGLNTSGELGLNNNISRSSPVQIGTSSWIAVARSAKSNFNAAIRTDNTLFVWGNPTNGRLGNEDTVNRSSPVILGITVNRGISIPTQVGTSSWTSIGSIQATITAVRSDGALFGWGRNNYGQLGDNTNINRSSPVLIGGSSSWTSVASRQTWAGGGFRSLHGAIRSDGYMFLWGYNRYGNIGTGSGQPNRVSSPVQLGNNNTNVIVPFQLGTQSWKSISSGKSHTAAIRSDNLLFTWGRNNSGQLGVGDTIDRSSPVQVGTSSWLAVSAGFEHTAAIRPDGRVFTWGRNNSGQLGDLTQTQRNLPTELTSASGWNLTSFIAISAGYAATLGIRSNYDLISWGRLGANGSANQNRSSPSTVFEVRNSFGYQVVDVSSVSSNGSAGDGDTVGHTLVVTRDGKLRASGGNVFGQCGTGTTGGTIGMTIIGANTSWVAASAGEKHSAAISTTGQLFTWGRNNYGQLGVGDTIHRSSPVQVGTSSWVSVACGQAHTIAVKIDGTIWAWGRGRQGETGLSTNTLNIVTDTSSPVQIGSDTSWIAISTKGATTFAGIKKEEEI